MRIPILDKGAGGIDRHSIVLLGTRTMRSHHLQFCHCVLVSKRESKGKWHLGSPSSSSNILLLEIGLCGLLQVLTYPRIKGVEGALCIADLGQSFLMSRSIETGRHVRWIGCDACKVIMTSSGLRSGKGVPENSRACDYGALTTSSKLTSPYQPATLQNVFTSNYRWYTTIQHDSHLLLLPGFHQIVSTSCPVPSIDARPSERLHLW